MRASVIDVDKEGDISYDSSVFGKHEDLMVFPVVFADIHMTKWKMVTIYKKYYP